MPSLNLALAGDSARVAEIEMEMGMAVEEYALTSLLAMAVGFLLVLVAYLYEPYWKMRHVPGPVPLPLIGNLPLLARHGPDVFSVLARKHGPVFRFHMGSRQPLVIVADAELCRQVGIKKFKSFRNRSLPSPVANSAVLQKGLFMTRDSTWSALRNIIVSIYQPSHLASLVPRMQPYIERVAKSLGEYSCKEEEVAFSTLALSLSTDIMGQAAFGVDLGLSKGLSKGQGQGQGQGPGPCDASTEFVKMHLRATTSLKMDMTGSLSNIVGLLVPFLYKPFHEVLRKLPGCADREIDRVNRDLSSQLDAIVADAVEARELSSPEQNDFLTVVLAARDRGGTAVQELLTPDYVSALTYEHILTGSSSTAFTISTVVYLVAKHPNVEEKLLQEIDAFGPHGRVPTVDHLHTEFPYLDQLVKESLRFYMASPLVARETSEKVEIGGYVLPKGTWVWIAPGVLAKDPMNFPEPEQFRPERFDPTGDEEKKRHPYAFIPFGLGPRSCIGQKFAIQEIKLAIIHLYRQYVFRHSPAMESPLEFQYGVVVNFKHGVKLLVIKRHT